MLRSLSLSVPEFPVHNNIRPLYWGVRQMLEAGGRVQHSHGTASCTLIVLSTAPVMSGGKSRTIKELGLPSVTADRALWCHSAPTDAYCYRLLAPVVRLGLVASDWALAD